MAVRGVKWPGRANLVVSLVAIHKGAWKGKCVLDGCDVPIINAFFEESEDDGEAKPLSENAAKVFQGVIFLGDGFLLTHEEADKLIQIDENNGSVIFKVINGQELNNNPLQQPGRSIINFFDWKIEKALRFEAPFAIVEAKVKPYRATQNRARNRNIWWSYAEHRPGLNKNIMGLSQCFVAARTTKYLNFSSAPTRQVFLDTINVFTTDRWDLYAVVQSTLHEVWARKYSGALETRLRYSPSDCFETFPFPQGLWQRANTHLTEIGEHYHEHRRRLMRQLWLGLTDIYNLFHRRDLTPEYVAKVSKKSLEEAEAGFQGILELRSLHHQLDNAIRDAYGWSDLDLGHDFHEVETLAENDRVRYTISPAARKEILKRLLALNHQRAAEQATTKPPKTTTKRTRKTKKDERQGSLF